jgi:hypothetical protein
MRQVDAYLERDRQLKGIGTASSAAPEARSCSIPWMLESACVLVADDDPLLLPAVAEALAQFGVVRYGRRLTI